MERDFSKIKRIVVKVGSSTLTYKDTHKLNLGKIDDLSKELCDIANSGIEVILVSSGAIATGMAKLNIAEKPKELEKKQMLACVGQGILMEIYNRSFSAYGYTIGQLLLTRYVIDNNNMKHNFENCLFEMLENKIIPIINENDSISVDEIKLGDNDNLSYLVASLVNADMLILLSDIDGLYDKNPTRFQDAIKYDIVEDFSKLKISNDNTQTALGTGGIETKLNACKMATSSGIDCVIANGSQSNILRLILKGEKVGTYFVKQNLKN